MHFVLFSDIDEASIRDKLGKPEYSYYFVLKAFRPAIEQLGEVTIVHDPATEVDPIYEACAARGERCVFISFSPPNSVTLGLKCPTVVVFAWEFSTLPDGAWDPDNPRSDWHFVLRTLGRAISLSSYTARVTKAEMGADFPIFAIAAPVWDRIVKPGRLPAARDPMVAERELRIRGTVIDTATLTLYPEKIFEPGFPPPIELPPVPEPPPAVAEPDPEAVPSYMPKVAFPESVLELPPEPEPTPPETASEAIVPEIVAVEPQPEPLAPPPRHPRTVRYVLAVTKRHAVGWYRETLRGLLPSPLRWVISRFGRLMERLYRSLVGRQPPPQFLSVLAAPDAPPPRYPRNLRYLLAATKRHMLEWYREAIRELLPDSIRWVVSRIGATTERLYRVLTFWKPPQPVHPGEAAPRSHGLRYILAVTKRHAVEWYREAIRPILPRWLRWIISRIGIVTERTYRWLTGWKPPTPPVVVAGAPPPSEIVIAELEVLPPPVAVIPEPEKPAPLEPIVPEQEPVPPPPQPPMRPEVSVRLGGIVYTSVLNPADGRKNWLDIITAFCWAFRDNAEVTLVLKMIKGDSESYRHELFIRLAQLAPFKCRMVTLDGYLEDADYARLIEATTYYVNASNNEGLCLPLMEFMALGKPAIAPRHTAMQDYIDTSAAFIVDSSPEHNVWPNDPRQRFTTMRERIHWDTLVTAYEDSYRVAREDSARYRAMGDRAADIIRDYSCDAVVKEQLRVAFKGIAYPEPPAAPELFAAKEEPPHEEAQGEPVMEMQSL